MFAIDLPRVDLDAIQPAILDINLNALPDRPLPENTTILVVDDEPLIRDSTCTLLEHWGYNVITASNGRDALQQLTINQRSPDVIICDYLLGCGENGVMIITMLRDTFNKDIPALLVTGITLPEHIETIQASGLPFMYKPLNQDKLSAALTQLNYVQ